MHTTPKPHSVLFRQALFEVTSNSRTLYNTRHTHTNGCVDAFPAHVTVWIGREYIYSIFRTSTRQTHCKWQEISFKSQNNNSFHLRIGIWPKQIVIVVVPPPSLSFPSQTEQSLFNSTKFKITAKRNYPVKSIIRSDKSCHICCYEN